MDTALVIIDMQMMMQERIDSGREHVNPEAPSNIVALAGAFREAGNAIIHVRHQDDDPQSPLHPGALGYQPMPCGREFDSEPVFIKKKLLRIRHDGFGKLSDRTGYHPSICHRRCCRFLR